MHNTRSYKFWIFPALILVLAAAIELYHPNARSLFQYQGDWFQNSEYWRAISGHFTHLGWRHLLLNASGFILIWILYGKLFKASTWLIMFLFISLGISFGFTIFDTDIESYVGLSGVLHGFMAAAVIAGLQQEMKTEPSLFPWESAIMIIGLSGKIIYEQIIGPVPFTQPASGGDVVVNAHFYGVIIGGLCGLLITAYNRNS